jgi:hypothetical protein
LSNNVSGYARIGTKTKLEEKKEKQRRRERKKERKMNENCCLKNNIIIIILLLLLLVYLVRPQACWVSWVVLPPSLPPSPPFQNYTRFKIRFHASSSHLTFSQKIKEEKREE